MDADRMGSRGDAPTSQSRAAGLASLIIGVLCLAAWCIPLCGFPVCIAGIILGIVGLRTEGRLMGIIGIVLSSLGLIATLANAVLGAWMAYQGQSPFLPPPSGP